MLGSSPLGGSALGQPRVIIGEPVVGMLVANENEDRFFIRATGPESGILVGNEGVDRCSLRSEVVVWPIITSHLSANAKVDQPFEYRITATNNPLYFKAGRLPVGLSLDASTGIISGTPIRPGQGQIQLSATNNLGSGPVRTLWLNIRSMPSRPTNDLEIWRSDRAIDIRTVQNTQFPMGAITIDWSLRNDGTLDDTQALATAMVVALGTDHRADAGEALPDPDSTDRRGWWGDMDAEAIWDGWPIGSKLWLLRREKITGPAAYQGATTVRVENYIREAVEPFIARRIGTRMAVEATRHGKERIDALIRLYRGPSVELELRYSVLWSGIMESGAEYDIGGAEREI